MEYTKFSFSGWLSSKQAVSFCLAVGVVFLISNYQVVLHNTNPDSGEFTYPEWLLIVFSHIDSLFFGLATAIIIFQSRKDWHKKLYCAFEGIMIFLNLNRELFEGSEIFLSSYIAIFSAFTLFYLGDLAKFHHKKEEIENEILEEEKAINESLKSNKSEPNKLIDKDKNAESQKCENCGKEFYSLRKKKYCSTKCRNQKTYKNKKNELAKNH